MDEEQFVPKAPTTPEYLVVQVPGHEGEKIDVLVDGLVNGRVGQLIVLTPGSFEISVDLPGATIDLVELRRTTHNRPKVVVFKGL